jgi:hypothetical protein
MPALERFHLAANDTLVALSEKLWPEAKIVLVIYSPGRPEIDIVLKDQDANPDDVVSALRRHVLYLDGTNLYKRDLCDSITGALAFGKQNTNPPPDGHWGQHFWDIGRAEGAEKEELAQALKLCRENLRACQAVIHLAGGFDPAYVNDAQAAMKVADEALAKCPPLNPA